MLHITKFLATICGLIFRIFKLQIVSDTQQITDLCQSWRNKGESISFVPTMGCLHEGHLSLINKAKSLADHVVVSIFVNPLQFDDPDDFLKYPYSLDDDVPKLADFNVDLVFTPDVNSLYPEGESEVEKIDMGAITESLEGEKRPGHFAGVATVVKRLFDMVLPTFAVFGEKDFQQLMLIQQLVDKFDLNIKIISMPTFRESDGLAMSSRNIRLDVNERTKAAEIFRQLSSIKSSINEGEVDFHLLEEAAFENLKISGFFPEYVAIRDANTLLPPEKSTSHLVALVAAKLGEIRLIDNIRL